MLEEKIQRINELYRKSKAEGLTEAELKEQKILRAEYIEAFKRNLRGQLDNIPSKNQMEALRILERNMEKSREQKRTLEDRSLQ